MILPYAVYILECKNGQYYTGFSRNLGNRLRAHRRGEVSFTRDKLPVKLIHVVFFKEVIKAYDYERYLKSGSGIAFRNKRLI
ncbi:GIY-YIG nuclease family protein [Lentiprolixibacter aurantiacus]|uniref:GIY-YIG nuclease family protein n=1 Tax=Lentiprolixibacter aurantiacus TaxID=2993939 RepID=A0AAE3MNL7_9FLAO|nr:GIY-YIG nuclease family protein [Lentiprolixibacter aurantiacus]MCX2720606.1 GIY-YIG nuclease family protein [Lentiprolixibacter aurantiacus]